MASIPEELLRSCSEGDPTQLFVLQKELAVGSFGTVYKAQDKRNNGGTVAVKIIAIEEGIPCSMGIIADTQLPDETFEDLLAEIQILQKCNHPNIVGYHGTWLKGKELFIVMELCEGGSLLSIYDGAPSDDDPIPHHCPDFPKDVVPCTERQIAFVIRETLKVNSCSIGKS